MYHRSMKKYIVLFFICLPFLASASFDKDLYYGIQGDSQVKELQEFLTDQGLYSGPITGNFFSLTLIAVKKFQTAKYILPVSGYFGPLTRGKANAVLSAEGVSSNSINTESEATASLPMEIPKTANDLISTLMAQIVALQKQLDALMAKQAVPEIASQQSSAPTQVLPSNPDLKYAVIYVYESADTYNPNWHDIKKSFDKVSAALESLSGGKHKAEFDILGEKKINDYCWNPATLMGYKTTGGLKFYAVVPGSQFSINSGVWAGSVADVSTTCPHCKVSQVKDDVSVENTCANKIPNFAYDEGGFGAMKQRLLQELTTNPGQYDDTMIVFGRLGPAVYDANYTEYRCKTSGAGPILAFSNFATSEYVLDNPNPIINCAKYATLPPPAIRAEYENINWKVVLHEILHHFGAVDVYQTGLNLGVTSQYGQALSVDPNVQESIMGNQHKPCQDLADKGVLCTLDQLDQIYLDTYNRKLMGW